jgi:predicted phosphoribosyltransferase
VILVDDGLATGATMRAAVAALRKLDPGRVVVAVPVAPPETCEVLRAEADEVVCLSEPDPFMAIGVWYEEFPQLTDDEVRELLREVTAGARPG